MNKKLIHKINGGLAIYYGIGCVIVAIIGLVVIGMMLFKLIVGGNNYSWLGFAVIFVITLVMGLMGYSILRVGYEEIER
jgi:accessory gene regulator protein AgrB